MMHTRTFSTDIDATGRSCSISHIGCDSVIDHLPSPRRAEPFTCAVITLYGASFILFLMPWMEQNGWPFAVKVGLLWIVSAAVHLALLTRREELYGLCCRMLRRRVRFFELPYFVLVSVWYGFVFLGAPFLLGLLQAPVNAQSLVRDETLTMYALFGGGASLVIGAISGLDIYPVNTFGTRASLEHLISITRDLMRLSNRLLVLISGSVLVGWAFQKVEFSVPVIYATIYGVVGFGLGSTGALGARVTDLLYELSAMERADQAQTQKAKIDHGTEEEDESVPVRA